MTDDLRPSRDARERPGQQSGTGGDQVPRATERLAPDQINRLWDYRNHVDQEFFGRLNFFLVFESILLAAAGQLLLAGSVPTLAIKAFMSLGLLITAVWAYSQARIKFILDWLSVLCRENIPEYRLFRAFGNWPISSMTLLTYAIPLLVSLIWVILLLV